MSNANDPIVVTTIDETPIFDALYIERPSFPLIGRVPCDVVNEASEFTQLGGETACGGSSSLCPCSH